MIGKTPAAEVDISQKGRVLAEYVWIDGTGVDTRSKTMVLDEKPKSVAELRVWNFDGSSTGQAPGEDSEVQLKPVRIYSDPFRGGDNILVLCECVDGDMRPLPSNKRASCVEAMERVRAEKPWFGIEQEYGMLSGDGWPLGWPKGGFPAAQGAYYCSAGADRSFGRAVAEKHLLACLHAGVKLSGVNAEVMPGQWEFQVGPCEGIEEGDDLWMARYILQRVAETAGVIITLDPKPVPGDWNGAGAHCNFSTLAMRTAGGGYDAMVAACEKLSKKHAEHIAVYGEGNERRLTGKHETASIANFSYGVADRGASIRIGRHMRAADCGYIEDRRPASNIDPYVVTERIVRTVCLDE